MDNKEKRMGPKRTQFGKMNLPRTPRNRRPSLGPGAPGDAPARPREGDNQGQGRTQHQDPGFGSLEARREAAGEGRHSHK